MSIDVLESPARAAQYAFKFAFLVALGAIVTDAVIAHGLFWDNDPYWTYWITKTLLITTIFSLGTALFGMGFRQGFAITAVHTLVLEVYNWWFAPVGLPQEPEWLDFNHVWGTGIPAHYLAILTGYLGALWIWRRNRLPEVFPPQVSPRLPVLAALAASALVLVFDGIITHGIMRRSFPGVTYFIQHLLVTFVVSFAWISFVGFERLGWLVGSFVLSIVLVGYGMYVGPVGLPHSVHYLGYEELWFKAFPGAVISTLLAYWLGNKLLGAKGYRGPTITAAILLLIIPAISSADGLPASASSSGPIMQVIGGDPVNMNSTISGEGQVNVQVVEKGNRWSHIQNTDELLVRATFTANGTRWDVDISKPMPRHPLGLYTTWNGVVFRHEMHGGTGIGTSKIPKVKPEIALWGWAEVRKNGVLVDSLAPAHLMVMKSGPMQGVMLEVATEDKSLLQAPDHFLTVMWPHIDTLSMPDAQNDVRQVVGWIVLLLLPSLFGWLALREGKVVAEHL